MPRRAEGQRGFTLLEVLVAFLIGSLATAALIEGVSRGVASARIAAETQEATSRARSRLALLELEALQPLQQSGEEAGGFRWQARVEPVAAAGGQALYEIRVVVAWPDGRRGMRQVQLVTRRLGAAR